MVGEGEPALVSSSGHGRTRGRRALERRLAGTRKVVGQVDNKDLGVGRARRGSDQAMKGQRTGLARTVGAKIALGTDPALLESPADLVGAGLGLGDGATYQNGECIAVVIARMRGLHADRTGGHGDADVALIGLMAGRAGVGIESDQHLILVGGAHPAAVRAEDMDV